MDFDIIATAGVTQQEFGDLVGVSRVTVNRWAKGHTVCSSKARATKRVLAKLKVAVKLGILPSALSSPARGTSVARRAELTAAFTQVDEAIEAHRNRQT